MRYDIEGQVVAPAPGEWVCPTCGRRRDRVGDRVTMRWCTGLGWNVHGAFLMQVERR